MLVGSKEILNKCKLNKAAIPATNFIDMNSARVFTSTAQKLKLPLILAYAQSHKDILSLEEAALIGKYYAEKSDTPVVLHLDHGEDEKTIKKAIDLGFSSVMIDASSKSFKENIEITKKIVEYAHKNGVSVEAELGHVGNNASKKIKKNDSIYTEVKDVIEFEKQTGVDSLAVSIGTSHGLYKGKPKLNFQRLKDINEVAEIPLVLHGGSSSGEENLKKCVENGICKINIYTDFIVAAYKAIDLNIIDDYIEIKNIADEAMRKVLINYFNVFSTDRLK